MGLTFRGSVILLAKHTYEIATFSGWAYLLAALMLSLPNYSFPCSSSRLKISSIGHEKDIDSVQTDEHRDEN